MKSRISRFSTISQHEAKLRQPHVVIECLVAVLDYIKTVLNDDSTTTLVEMVRHHFVTKDDTAHHLNVDLMSDQIIDEVYDTFVDLAIFNDDETLRHQFISFFRDIYDGSEGYVGSRILKIDSDSEIEKVIPKDRNSFLRWLLTNPDILIWNNTDDLTDTTKAITARIVNRILKIYHDDIAESHQGVVVDRLANIMAVSSVAPIYIFAPLNFITIPYALIGGVSYNRLIALLTTRLISMGSPDTVDFESYDDTLVSAPFTWVDEEVIMGNTFLTDIYDEEWVRTIILQLGRASILALYLGGTASFAGYGEYLSDYGEDDGVIFHRKYIDYYADHLRFVLSPTMLPEYRDILIDIRGNVNTNFCKSVNVFTILNKYNFSINTAFSIGKQTTERTLDLINMIGLSKSIVNLSLVPYHDVNGNLLNRIDVAFDNYNPAFTATLVDGLTGALDKLSVTIAVSDATLTVHTLYKGLYSKTVFGNVGRMYDVDPFILFLVPRVDVPQSGKIRLNSVRLYSKALSDDDALIVAAGSQL